MKVVHRIRPIGQVVEVGEDFDDELMEVMAEMRAEIVSEMRDNGLIPLKSGNYHTEVFALSSMIYLRICTEVMDDDEIEEARAHVA